MPRSTVFRLFHAPWAGLLGLACAAAVHAQAPAASQPAEAPAVATGTEQKIERIRVEDAGSRIDELRVGGETRSITVSPKGGAPAYEVQPAGNRSPAAGNREGNAASGGPRVWNVLNF
jgi:hypothetical protein